MLKKQTQKLCRFQACTSEGCLHQFFLFCFLCRSREKAFEIFAALPWPFYFFKLVFYPQSAPSFKVISSSALLRQHSALKRIWIVVTECLRQFKGVSQRLGDLQLPEGRVLADLHWVDTFCRDGTLGSLMAWTCRTRWEQEAHLSAIMRSMTVKGEDKKRFLKVNFGLKQTGLSLIPLNNYSHLFW